MVKRMFIFQVAIIAGLFVSFAGCGKEPVANNNTPPSEAPSIGGMVVFERSVTGSDSDFYILDLASGKVGKISNNWGIGKPERPVFSPDGAKVAFSGIGVTNTYDVFVYSVAEGGQPLNLTAEGKTNDRWPRFSADGSKLIFSRDGQLAEISVATGAVAIISEESYSLNTPSYISDGGKALCSAGSGAASFIALYDPAAKKTTKIADRSGVGDIYPVPLDPDSFCFNTTAGGANTRSQIYRGFFDGRTPQPMPFNNVNAEFADAAPIDAEWAIMSSNRSGSAGGFDLFVADTRFGTIFPLSVYGGNVNTAQNETAPHYVPVAVTVSQTPGDGGGGPENNGFNICGDTDDRPLDAYDEFYDDGRPKLYGKLVFHRYESYGTTTPSSIWVYDFWKRELTCVSENWDDVTINPMNGFWSPDGKYIAFMGYKNNDWRAFVWEVGADKPATISTLSDSAGEDPKYSYDGKDVVWKRRGVLYNFEVASQTVTRLTSVSMGSDFHIPQYLPDNRRIIYCSDATGAEAIWTFDTATGERVKVADLPGVDYYPISRDNESFYFSAHYNGSAITAADQLYMGFYDGREPVRMAWNTSSDTSDACYVNQKYVMVCSTRRISGVSKGGYDYYIAEVNSSKIWSLNLYDPSLNTGLQELGACYLPSRIMLPDGGWASTPEGMYWNSGE